MRTERIATREPTEGNPEGGDSRETAQGDSGLFPEPDRTAAPDVPVDELAGLSPDRRRTVKQRRAIERGFHPLTGRPLLARDFSGEVPPGPTCGDCRKRFVIKHHNRSYGKCEERGDTSCAASDCRKWWPACDLFEAS